MFVLSSDILPFECGNGEDEVTKEATVDNNNVWAIEVFERKFTQRSDRGSVAISTV